MGRSFVMQLLPLLAVCGSAASLATDWSPREQAALDACPCADVSLCLPVERSPAFEVFAFSPSANSSNWHYYDFSTVTTIAWNLDKDLLCHAHAHHVKIVISHNFDAVDKLCDAEARRAWVEATYDSIVAHYADGVNIDTEAGMSGAAAKCQTQLVRELRARLSLSKFTQHAQISFDVPWSPHGIDQRYYDWVGLATYADLLFVMSYDMRSQIYYQCLAGANSPLALVQKGLEEYMTGYGIPPSKLVLGLPWYGYDYPCTALASTICHIQPVPFRGAPCSDAAGRQLDYAAIVARLGNVVPSWDEIAASPYFTPPDATTSQIWFDNDRSLAAKYDLAREMHLLGVGMWHIDALDYSGKETPVASTAKMWQTLRNAVPTQVRAIANPMANE
ncbi:Aste57867_17968 [Aphanomyces stellatus]|uniref:Aste57867_17968 protein n=1 Tax=Aphanomyces stellatus TaxID=120398 RepID=A0A485L9R3_9STRA|nr:hypothetical protein As57867_017906 [Aphanomyces stellatus]VFT94708.1 Aste57867_17968 [Aphanomyces stellatus]